MDTKQTVDYINKKYNVITTEELPLKLFVGRFEDIPKLFEELKFERGAEIGVYRGQYSNILLNDCSTLKNMICVDAWEDYKGYHSDDSGVDYDVIPDMKSVYEFAKDLLSKHGSKVKMLKGWSVDVAKTIPDGSLDFVFLDGNHAYEYVVADIAAWAPKVRKGGIIYGHDYDDYQSNKRHCYSINVINAVIGWTKSNKINPWYVLTNTKGDKRRHCWLYVK